jgi:hypothetical protein
MRKTFVIGILLLAAAGSLQAQTNLGTDFWMAETANFGCPSDFAISIANPNAVVANAVIDNVLMAPMAVTVAPGTLETRTFPCRARCLGSSGNNLGKNMVYHVTSDVEVAVYTFNPLANVFTNDASLILPVPTLGQNHRVGDYVNPRGNTRGSQFGVVAVVDNTNVQTFNTAGVPVDNITINQGDYFQRTNGSCSGFFDPVSTDVTGWSVVTDKPAAVFTGSVCTSLGTATGACDHLDEQVLPEEALATTYVACPSLTRPIGCNPTVPGSCSPDHFRYVATEDATTVSTSPVVTAGVLNKGQFLQVETSTPHIVSADKPIYGYQYMISQASGPPTAGTGDPALFGIPPVGQFQFSYIFLTPNTYAFDFINVVAPVGTNLTLDGGAVTDTCHPVGFIGGTEYCCFGKSVADGVHTIAGDQQFGLSVTGFDNFASYAYIGGLGLQPINAGCDTGGPYQEISCDVPLQVPLDGTPSCSDGSVPSVAWSSSDGVTFDDATLDDPIATVPDFGTFGICMEVTCGQENPVQCCSTIEVIEQTVGCNEPPVVTPDLDTVTVHEGQTATNGGTVSDPDGDTVGLSASIGTVINNNDGTWSWSFPAQDGPADSQTVTITGDDGNGGVTQVDFSLTVNNVPPSVVSISVPSEPVNINDQPVSVSAGFSDPAGIHDQPYTCEVNYGDGSAWQAGLASATTCIGPGHTYAEAGVYQVLVTVTDKDGGTGSGMATELIVIYDPSAGFVTGGGWIDSPVDAYYPTLPFFDGSFYELVESPGTPWNDAQAAASEANTVSCASPHLVTITSEQEQEALIEFFDGALQGKWYGGWQEPGELIPDQGWHWVTEEPWEYTNWAPGEPNDAYGPGSEPHLLGWAGGWAWNDEGNLDNVTGYVIEYDDCVTGKATFGFVSKYKKGATVPTGNTEFQFHAVGLNFHSDSYEWLVVTGGDYAKFKGVGTINGEGEYKFKLWAGDGEPDTFRIKIWTEDEENAVETVIYDNGFDQEIGGGSIVIHAKNK